jgi:hypothetical protein
VKLHWMLLANHAEDHNGLVSLIGGGWDTVNVSAPAPAGFPGVAPLQGALVIRLLFHATETDRRYPFVITVLGEDGQEVAKVEGDMDVKKASDLPFGWDQGQNIVLSLTGLPVPNFGQYVISLQVGGQHLGDLPFRVVKRY